MRLPTSLQRAGFGALTAASRLSSAPRAAPPVGEPAHLTSVLRLPPDVLPRVDVEPRHHRYPPTTVHVTVANLDRATRPVAEAVARLRGAPPDAVRLTLDGLGRSPDTLFVRCLDDGSLARLRAAVRGAFVAPRPGGVDALVGALAFANVVRFDGGGAWPGRLPVRGAVRLDRLEIVRTDRYLSDVATEVLATVPLA